MTKSRTVQKDRPREIYPQKEKEDCGYGSVKCCVGLILQYIKQKEAL